MARKFSDYTEPAAIRGIITAVVGLCAALGIVLPFDLPGLVEVLLPVLTLVLPLVQAVWTRTKVWSPASHNEALGRHAAGLGNGPAV